MHRRRVLALLVALAASALLLAACGPRPPEAHGTLIVLRHADRTRSMLNEKGVARAAALPAALAGIPIDAIYATQRQRNIDTATPLARARRLAIHTMPAFGAGTRMFQANPGKTIVWIGNQENLGFLWMELGIPGIPPLRYGELFIVTLPKGGGPAIVEQRRYGP